MSSPTIFGKGMEPSSVAFAKELTASAFIVVPYQDGWGDA
jgi:hypothetical protein